MKRRLFTLTAGLSLVLCIATVALWVRSFVVADAVSWNAENRAESVNIRSSAGNVTVVRTYLRFTGNDAPPIHASSPRWSRAIVSRTFEWSDITKLASRFHAEHDQKDYPALFNRAPGRSDSLTILFPHWALALVLLMMPAAHLVHVSRHKRQQHRALCPTCGYDLRATPERCPECGRVPEV